jgi:iron complex outermembrane receptor protein
MRLKIASSFILACAGLSPAGAQTAPADDRLHTPLGDAIIVTAARSRPRADLLSSVSVLQGTALVRDLRPTLGETLARQPGVSSTSFGPNASRPVLRGFQGERVRMLVDGIGSFDVSNTSVDHAVVADPLTAERIEILRGPSALLYGSSAVGGVVNIVDKRIPRAVPQEAVHVELDGQFGSAAREKSGAGAIDIPLGGRFVVHADAAYTDTDDLRIGGYALTPALRAQAAASADPEINEAGQIRGRLPNTAMRGWRVAAGGAYIGEGGNIGISVARNDSLYGVPIRYPLESHDEEDGEGDHGHDDGVRIDLRQWRADLRAEIAAGGPWIDALRVRAGYADYAHSEIEDDGGVGTRFLSEGMEARVELAQTRRGAWTGTIGGQLLTRDLRIIGEEKFIPPSQAESAGLFTVQELDLGRLKLEGGLRFERSVASAVADADLGTPAVTRRFSALSYSLGAGFDLAQGWRVSLNGSRASRAPSVEEMFAAGPHAGTQSFEIGDPTLRLEKSWGLEAMLRGAGTGYRVELSAHHSWFDNYIYEQATGDVADELPVFRINQGSARYWGLEANGSVTLARAGAWTFNADGVADYVRARIRNVGPAPRIPPLRLLGGLEAQSERLDGRVEVEWARRQNSVSDFETRTGGFTLVNASLAWRPLPRARSLNLVLSANNIFDVVARRHASFLKDYAPLAGRDVRLGVRASF